MSAEKLTATVDIEVPFHDLDPVNIVWHGNYAKYLEAARDALMRSIGFSHPEMMQAGVIWPVTEMKLRYVRAARLGERLRVTATLLEYDPRLKIGYEIRELGSGSRCTRAHTIQVPVTWPDGTLLFAAPAALTVPIENALREVAQSRKSTHDKEPS